MPRSLSAFIDDPVWLISAESSTAWPRDRRGGRAVVVADLTWGSGRTQTALGTVNAVQASAARSRPGTAAWRSPCSAGPVRSWRSARPRWSPSPWSSGSTRPQSRDAGRVGASVWPPACSPPDRGRHGPASSVAGAAWRGHLRSVRLARVSWRSPNRLQPAHSRAAADPGRSNVLGPSRPFAPGQCPIRSRRRLILCQLHCLVPTQGVKQGVAMSSSVTAGAPGPAMRPMRPAAPVRTGSRSLSR